ALGSSAFARRRRGRLQLLRTPAATPPAPQQSAGRQLDEQAELRQPQPAAGFLPLALQPRQRGSLRACCTVCETPSGWLRTGGNALGSAIGSRELFALAARQRSCPSRLR